MARETVENLKKKHKKEIDEIKKAMHLRCADCMGYFIDSKECKNKKCPLRRYFPKKQTIESQGFRKKVAKLALDKKNDETLINLIVPPEKKVVKKIIKNKIKRRKKV